MNRNIEEIGASMKTLGIGLVQVRVGLLSGVQSQVWARELGWGRGLRGMRGTP